MRKDIKYFLKKVRTIGCLIFTLCCFLCSCQNNQKVAGINEPVNNENVIIEIKDLFIDFEQTYIVVEVKLSEHGDVYDGELAQVFIDITGEAGYSYSCIGYNESSKSQMYLVSINSNKPPKGKIKLTVLDYRSASNPMRDIVNAEWSFSIDSNDANSLLDSLNVNDSMISEIKIFDEAIVIIPSTTDIIDELRTCEIKLYDENGELIEQTYNSFSNQKCNLSFGFIIPAANINQRKVSSIVIEQNEYHFES
jgi:hypothetical protein